jgi:membrane protein DedA with SNARE-associated domain
MAGSLRAPYLMFAASVAVSTAVWAAVFLYIGIRFGNRVSDFLNAHHGTYVVVAGLVSIGVAYTAFRVIRELRSVPVASSPEAGEPKAEQRI